jgi:hypothetical protein
LPCALNQVEAWREVQGSKAENFWDLSGAMHPEPDQGRASHMLEINQIGEETTHFAKRSIPFELP